MELLRTIVDNVASNNDQNTHVSIIGAATVSLLESFTFVPININ